MPDSNAILIRDAREHNLKGISLSIPRGKIVVITGVSGSGKSSLALDTIFAEGQRRFVETLSSYARQFLERVPRPHVESIEGIPPAIAIEQKNPTKTSRSTVATATEIHDHLRLLYANIGVTRCPECDIDVGIGGVQKAVADALELPTGSKALVVFTLRWPRDREESEKVLAALTREGFVRLRLDGEVKRLEETEAQVHSLRGQGVEVVVDRLTIKPEVRSRLAESLETALAHGRGVAKVVSEGGEEVRVVADYACPSCGRVFDRPSPLMFSFNSPLGACPHCRGFGDALEFDVDLIVPDKDRTLAKGAIEPWHRPQYRPIERRFLGACESYGIPTDVPYKDLELEAIEAVWEGMPGFGGVNAFFRRLQKKSYKVYARFFVKRYQRYVRCAVCEGMRLRPEALWVNVGGRSISDVCALTVREAREFMEELDLAEKDSAVASDVLRGLEERLTCLDEIGLGYLTLDRASRTLSGGEYQRIALATSLGAGLTGTLYVLDEPTVGLHSRDTHRLIKILRRLKERGNTVLLVEHDMDVIKAASYVIDLGPGAGERGGELVFCGSVKSLLESEESLTAQYLTGRERVERALGGPRPQRGRSLKIRRATHHNLKNLDVEIPLGMLVCVTGVSGSGKSTLVHDTLYKALTQYLGRQDGAPGAHLGIDGMGHVREVVLVDQSPIGKSPRSNPVTYTKCFDLVREVYGKTPESRARGYGPGRFSFNVPGGRCEVCQGQGRIREEMLFLADVFVECEECQGRRFNRETLQITFRGKNIAEVLDMSVEEAVRFFHGFPRITRGLKVLEDVGLGYLRLGQPATHLSGGEAQRIKIARELIRLRGGGTLYLMDEPTTGLHAHDVSRLLAVLHKLVERGGSVIVIEHNLDLIAGSDYIIDLGPEGGDAGGYLVAAGTPQEVASVSSSYTGRFLRRKLRS